MKKRITKFDRLAESVAQDHAHAATVDIATKRRVCQYEVSELDRAIVHLQAATARARERRNVLIARIAGLTTVVGKR